MQEMRFVLEHFADLCDIMPSDAVQEGDAGRNDPAATWTYMAGRLQKMGGGKTGRNRSYKERTFELGKNELRYKAGATKGVEQPKSASHKSHLRSSNPPHCANFRLAPALWGDSRRPWGRGPGAGPCGGARRPG